MMQIDSGTGDLVELTVGAFLLLLPQLLAIHFVMLHLSSFTDWEMLHFVEMGSSTIITFNDDV